MADKKDWREKYKEKNSTGKESTTSNWRDKYKEYYDYASAKIVGEQVNNMLDAWQKNYNSYVTDYTNRFSKRKGSYEDAYVGDSLEWLNAETKKQSALKKQEDDILAYLNQYGGHLDSKWVKQVFDTIEQAKDAQYKIHSGATKDNDYWAKFTPNEDQAAAGYTAEKLYNEWQSEQKQYAEDMAFDIYSGEVDLEILKHEKAMYLKEQQEKRKQAQENESWMDKVGRWLGTTPDTSLPLGGASAGSSSQSSTKYDSQIAALEEQINRAKYVQGYEGFMDNMDAEDYAANSQYASTRTDVAMEDAMWGVGNTQYDTSKLFGDFMYDYINRNEDALNAGMVNDTATDAYFLGFDKGFLKTMTDDEIGVYNYLYKTQGQESANAFLSHIESDLEGRRRAQEQAFWASYAKSDPVGSSVFSTLISPLKGMSYLGQAADMLDDGKMEENAGYNRFSYIPSTIRSQVSTTIEKSGKWGKVGSFAYNTGMSMADFLFTTAVSGGNQALSLAIMGSGAAADATLAAKDRGLDDAQAFTLGTIAGLAEVAMEKISLGAWLEGDMTEGALRYMLKNALSEGGEEAGTSVINLLADVIIAGDKSEWNMAMQAYIDQGKSEAEAFGLVLAENAAQIGLDALGGILSGAAIGGGTYAGASIGAGFQYGDIGKDKAQAQQLVTEGLELNPTSQYVQKAQSKLDKGKNLTGMQVRNILAANQEQVTANDMKKIQKAAEKRLTDLGQTKDVSKLAEIATKWATGQEITRAEKRLLTHSEYGAQVAKEMRDSVAQEEKATYKPLEKRVEAEKPAKVSDTGKTVVRATDDEIDLKSIKVKEISDDGVVLDVNGKDVDISEVDFATEELGNAFNALKKVEHITPTVASDMIAKIDTSKPIWNQLNGMDEAFTYGYWNYSEADLKAGLFASNLTKEQLNDAYKLGQYVRKNDIDAKTDSFKKMRTAADAIAEKNAADGKETPKSKNLTITYKDINGKEASLDEDKLEGNQAEGVAWAKILHKMGLGTKVEFFESYTKEVKDKKTGKTKTVRVFINDKGAEQIAYSGVYRKKDGTIRIDLNAYNGRGFTLNVLAHELTHFIQQWSDTKYKVLVNFLMKEYEKTDMTMHERVIEEQNRLRKIRGEDVSYDEAYDEVVANAMNKMFNDGNMAEKLAKLKEQDKNLAQKLLEGFKEILSKLIGVQKEGLFRDSDVFDEMKDTFDQLQNMFAEALVEASENYQASLTVSESQTLTEAGIGFDEDTKSVYSLHFSTAFKDEIQVGNKTFNTEAIAQVVAKGTGRSIEDARKWVQSELTIANIVMANPEFLDFEADNRYEAIKKNSDYPQGTVDLSNLCPKREEFTTMFDMLQKKYPNKLFTAQDVAEMRKILSDNDITVACGACFVEDRRQLLGEIADTYINMWKEAVETGKPLQKTNAAGVKSDLLVTKALAKQYGLTAGTKIMATDTYIPNQYDLTTYEGFKLLEKNHPTIAMGFNRYNNSRGQQSARLIEGRAEYKRQILGWSDAKVRSVNNNGGLRIFSFSDFEVVHLLDLVQVIIDCAAKGVKIQGYTKIPAFAKLVRDTGIKLNRSLIPKGDYGYHMENGKVVLDYDTTEGINIKDKNFIDESNNPNVGNIVIGINPTQISAAMLDPFIDYIIPFHSNKAKEILKKLGTGEWVNYKESQHEKDISTGTSSKHNVNIYTEVINKYHPTNKVEFVEAFLKECKREGKIPRYAEFLNVDENGDYAYREGYHKLLVDFKMFDAEGNILPQGNITPKLDEGFMTELLNAEIDKKQNYEFPQKVYEDIDKKFGEQYSSQDTDIDTDQKVTYHKEKTQEVKGNERREETREAFLRRASETLPEVEERGKTAFGFRRYSGQLSPKVQSAEKGLKKLGIPVVVFEQLEGNKDGVTTIYRNDALAFPGVSVFIHKDATVDALEIVGHEGYHYLAKTPLRTDYEEVLADNIDFTSKAIVAYQQKYVDDNYFAEDVEVGSKEWNVFMEEIFAYITGHIHAGDPKGEVRKFIRDYDAVNAAWDDLIKKQSADSLYSSQETDLDSDGNQLTKEQQEFFKDSKIRDNGGNLLVVRHGTNEEFHIFDFAKSGKNGKAEGYGFYFSDDHQITSRYGDIQKEVYLNITKPLYSNKRTIKKAELVKLTNALIDFNLEKYKSDGLVWQDSFISNYVNTYEFQMSRRYAVQEFVNQIWDYNTNDQDLVFEIAQGDGKMYDSSSMKEFYDVLKKSIGYDGIIAEWAHADGTSNVYVTFDSEQSKYTTNKRPTSNPDMRYSEHDTDYSNRSLLANAFEGITRDSIEYKMIQEYKGHIKNLNSLEKNLDKLNEEIRKIYRTPGKRDTARLKKLTSMAEEISKEITRHDKELLSLEASEPLRKVIERERKKEAQKTKAHVHEIQQNKKVRAEQTELRHKIRKTIRDLDKILNRGNKKQNVKEDMKGFASKALELADYLFTDHISNDDLIRKGITVRMTPKEAALVKETEDILSKLYDHADSLTDEEFTRLDAQRKKNLDKLRDLLTAQRNERLNTPVYNLFNDLVTEYAGLKNSKQDAVKAAYNPEVERFLRSYIGEANGEIDSDRKTLLQNMRVADMTTDELWKLHNAYKMVLHSVRTANELFVKGKTETLEQKASRIMGDFANRKIPDKKAAIIARNIANKIGWDYEKLYYALDRIGSEAFTELVMNIANSENIVMQDIMEAVAFRDEMIKKYDFNNWAVNKEIDREFLDNTGKKFKLTLGQLMALYAYSRREGAWDHIEYGGFVFGEAALTNPKPADSYKLSKAQCEAITGMLTKEQKGYAEDMQKFLSETMGEKGNEVSMLLYGIKMFGEKNYFPIHVAGQFKAQAQESQAKAAAGFSSMSNAGFTHAQNPNAKAPFVLEGFNEIWADHVNEMSRYHGTVPALEDMRRVMNRSFYSESGMESMAIKQLMENAFGKEAVDYFDSLYREANSGAITDKLQQKQKKLLSLFRKNSVAYSLSVVIQQPSAMSRAYAMIDKKYFGFKGVGALASGVAKAVSSKWNPAYANAYNEMKKYAPGVTMAKEIGGFDTHTGSSIREYLLDTGKSFKQSMQTENLKGKAKAALDLVDNNAVANLPAVADKIAWIEIWNACKREAVAKHRDLAPNSEEFMQAVGERFTEVIRATQVYDSMFSKSPMLKSKNLAVQYLVSFMNEPNTTANMVEKAVRDATKGDWKSGVRTAVAVTSSIIFNNVLKAVIYAMRDDDEDETYIEKYAEAVVSGMIADFNPLSYIPYVRDVVSKLQGYDVERPDMAIVTDAIEAYQAIVKNANKDTENLTEYQLAELDKKVTDASWKLVGSLAAFFGIPVKNIYREIDGIIDHVRIASANAGMTTPSSIWDKVTASIPFLESETAKADKLYGAIVAGDQAYIDRLKAGYVDKNGNFDQGKYDSAVVKALRENDPRINAAAQANVNGNSGERNRILNEIKAEGKFSASYIIDAINAETSAIRNEGKPDKVAGQYEANDFVEDVSAGDANTAKAVREDIISTYVANGKTQTEAENAFKTDVKSSVNEAYSYGTINKATAEKMLVEYADMDEEDAADKITYWDFCKTNPNCDLSESKVLNYLEFAEPAHVSLEVYEQFVNDTKDIADIKDKWGDVEVTEREQVLEVIDSLPLSWQQKDALYLAYGYKESTIWDVPW